MPAIEKIFQLAKIDPAFQEQLMQPTKGIGPLGHTIRRGDVSILHYLCQQDGIEVHASNRYKFTDGRNILVLCHYNSIVEIIEMLLDNFPWLASEREDVRIALLAIITRSSKRPTRSAEAVNAVKVLLQRAQAILGLAINVDNLLTATVSNRWPEMCWMLLVDAHANALTAVKMSSSGRLELKEPYRGEYGQERYSRKLDEAVLKAMTAFLSEEVLEAVTGAQGAQTSGR